MPIEVRYGQPIGAIGRVAAAGGGAQATLEAARIMAQRNNSLLEAAGRAYGADAAIQAAHLQAASHGEDAATRLALGQSSLLFHQQEGRDQRDFQEAQQGRLFDQQMDLEMTRQTGRDYRTESRIGAQMQMQEMRLSAPEQRRMRELEQQLAVIDQRNADGLFTSPEAYRDARDTIMTNLGPLRQRQAGTQIMGQQQQNQAVQDGFQASIVRNPNNGQPIETPWGAPLRMEGNGRVTPLWENPIPPAAFIQMERSFIDAHRAANEGRDPSPEQLEAGVQAAAQRYLRTIRGSGQAGQSPTAVGSMTGTQGQAPQPDELGRVPVAPPSPFAPPPPGQARVQPGAQGQQQPQFLPGPDGRPPGTVQNPHPGYSAEVRQDLRALATGLERGLEGASEAQRATLQQQLAGVRRLDALLSTWGSEENMQPAQRAQAIQLLAMINANRPRPQAPGVTAAPGAPSAGVRPSSAPLGSGVGSPSYMEAALPSIRPTPATPTQLPDYSSWGPLANTRLGWDVLMGNVPSAAEMRK